MDAAASEYWSRSLANDGGPLGRLLIPRVRVNSSSACSCGKSLATWFQWLIVDLLGVSHAELVSS